MTGLLIVFILGVCGLVVWALDIPKNFRAVRATLPPKGK
jgi:hypothetical protein